MQGLYRLTTYANHKIWLSESSVPFEKRAAHYVNLYPRHERPAESNVRRLVTKLECTGSIISQHPYAAETQNLLRTSLLCMRMYGKPRDSQFLVVHKNLAGLYATSTW